MWQFETKYTPNNIQNIRNQILNLNKRNLNGDELECGYYDQIVLMVQY